MDVDEEHATIEDFFSDEGQDSSQSSEDDEDDIVGTAAAAVGGKRGSKVGRQLSHLRKHIILKTKSSEACVCMC